MPAPVRTRFAPSPTGELHLGNLRVAVFNHLFAKHHGGAFLVRIEDTDVARNVPGSIEGILADLTWAGLDWDEGPDGRGSHGPYLQSLRGDRHRRAAERLLEEGWAYPCFCDSRPGDEAGSPEVHDGTGCPGACRDLEPDLARARRASGEPAALRFAVPDRDIVVEDAVRGEIRFPGADVGDFVILRADGRATYNFAVTIDDLEMEITHVIRGAGHLSNTPKQALVLEALGHPWPVWVHLPTVLAPGGGKLSKRTGAPGVRTLREEGYHPDAVVNYLSLLGWSPRDDREVMSREALVEAMDLEGVGASDTMYDPEKLRWMSAQHLQGMPAEALVRAVRPYLDPARHPLTEGDLTPAIEAVRSRLHTFGEVNEALDVVFASPEALQAAGTEVAGMEGAGALLRSVRDALAALPEWDAPALGAAVRQAGAEAGLRGPALFHPIRLALSGRRSGPDLGLLLAALGKQRALDRLDRILTEVV